MSKIICDICGTMYPDTAESCPICGCSRDAAADFLGDEFAAEEVVEETKGKGGRFTSRKKKEIFDFDEVNSELMEESIEEHNPYSEEEEPVYEERGGHNVVIVVILTILIVALLAAAAFIFFRYFLPNSKENDAPPPSSNVQIEQTQAPTTENSIPCEMLILTSGTAELSKEGQMFLLHVKPTPEDTTDEIIFTSADESVATVSSDGKVTAVAEGETMIYITCGNIQTTCPVVVRYVEETVPPTVETLPQETEAQETEAETEPEESASSIRTDVTLKLKQTDIRLGVYYEYQLKLDCDLEQDEVEWSSEHPHIATVDENGVIKAVKDGVTSITAKYGDQEVSCIVRCVY